MIDSFVQIVNLEHGGKTSWYFYVGQDERWLINIMNMDYKSSHSVSIEAIYITPRTW